MISESDLTKQSAARRKFNVHFTTFWHLVYLATANAMEDDDLRAVWQVTNRAGGVWIAHLSANNFYKINEAITIRLSFMDEKLYVASEKGSDKKAVIIVKNYDKCFETVKMLEDSEQMNNDGLNPATVCIEMVRCCNSGLDNFKSLSPVWSYLFASQIRHLLALAKVFAFRGGDEQLLQHWSEQHNLFTNNLRGHFSSLVESQPKTSSTDAVDSANLTSLATSISTAGLISSVAALNVTYSQLTEPAVPLDALIVTLNENTKCVSERIPTAVTSIIHDYCFIDLFNLNDAEFVKAKIISME